MHTETDSISFFGRTNVMSHTGKIKRQVKHLIEVEGLNCPQTAKRLGISKSTVWYWMRKHGWRAQEQSPESLLSHEMRRVVARESYSETDVRKIRLLGSILDEYAARRSVLAEEIGRLVERHRGAATEKRAVLDELIGILNAYGGTASKSVKKGPQAKVNDFSGYGL